MSPRIIHETVSPAYSDAAQPCDRAGAAQVPGSASAVARSGADGVAVGSPALTGSPGIDIDGPNPPVYGRRPLRRLEPAGNVFDIADEGGAAEDVDDTGWSEAGERNPGGLADSRIQAAPGVAAPPAARAPSNSSAASESGGSRDRSTHRSDAAPQCDRDLVEQRTTIMLQRISYDLDEAGLCRVLDELGFARTYDAIHVPRNRRQHMNLAYAFVNFVHPRHAEQCIRLCDGRLLGDSDTSRACRAVYATKQGGALVAKRFAETIQKHRRRERGGAVAPDRTAAPPQPGRDAEARSSRERRAAVQASAKSSRKRHGRLQQAGVASGSLQRQQTASRERSVGSGVSAGRSQPPEHTERQRGSNTTGRTST